MLTLLTVIACACGSPEVFLHEPPTVAELAGCWTLQVRDVGGRWHAADRPSVPDLVRLDTARLDVRSPLVSERTYRAWSIDGRTVRDIPFHGWRTTAGDSLWAGHPGGVAGSELRMALERDTLTGRLLSRPGALRRDVPPPAAARLLRTRCPEVVRTLP
ncbi:MAG: hypothetical protein R3266_08225 [Gemmatimonadota bacterium]|nr:hypothetical protein [Gemmatimonadota bacterium]